MLGEVLRLQAGGFFFVVRPARCGRTEQRDAPFGRELSLAPFERD